MKRWIMFLLTMLLLTSAALAETTVLGCMPDQEYIHQYTAPNGQLLWFTAVEEVPHIKFEDVNYDGHEDIVVVVTRGANNFFSEFFLYDAQADVYTLATHPGQDEGMCNYGLYPELGLVESFVNSGNAGLLHVRNLYRWEGNNLQLIRSAVSDEWSEDFFEGQTYTQIIHGDVLHITVRDHSREYDESVIWERIIPLEDVDYGEIHEAEMAAYWQGLI